MADANLWTCPTCNRTVESPYCSECGERPLNARELTFRGFLDQGYRAFSDIDTRLLRSFRTLLVSPGELTLAYVRGQRTPYIGPFKLFLAANVLFFTIQSLTSMNVFSSTLDSHLQHQDWSALAQSLVSRRLASLQTSLEAYAPVFNEAVLLNAKSLIILMALCFATLLPVVFYRERQPFMAHVVFALHLYSFLLLLFCFTLAIAVVDSLLGGAGLNSARMDNILSVINLSVCTAYLYLATGRFYKAQGLIRFLKVLALALWVAAMVLGYRFALFLITLYST